MTLAALPRPKASKRCTRCGSAGPFVVTGRRERRYWSSWCRACRNAYQQAYGRVYRPTHRAAAARYHRAWYLRKRARAQAGRLQHLLAQYAQTPTRSLANRLGRLTCPPGHRWCSYGQHAVLLHRFRPSRFYADGLQRLCARCTTMKWREQYAQRQARQAATLGGNPA
jgi:hypothetical protein